MIVFWHLLLAHLLADFPLHTDYIYRKKITNPFKGLSVHGLVYMVCLLICCLPYLEIRWFTLAGVPFNGVEAIFLLTFVHMASDYIDISDNHHLVGINAFMFVSWQLIEISVLFLAAPLIQMTDTTFKLLALKFIIIANGLIIATYVLMVLIHLFIKDFTHKNYPSFDERYVSMIYTGGLYMSLMLPSKIAFTTSVIWVSCWFFVFVKKKISFISKKNIMATILTICVALWVRNLIYYVY